jgi:hypothetical protein
MAQMFFGSIFNEWHQKIVNNLPDRCRSNQKIHLTPFWFLAAILDFCHHNYFYKLNFDLSLKQNRWKNGKMFYR